MVTKNLSEPEPFLREETVVSPDGHRNLPGEGLLNRRPGISWGSRQRFGHRERAEYRVVFFTAKENLEALAGKILEQFFRLLSTLLKPRADLPDIVSADPKREPLSAILLAQSECCRQTSSSLIADR
jgi:hypothetical protein